MSRVKIWFDEPPQQGWNNAEIETDEAPRTKPAASEVPCCVSGCKELASFIIERRAYCVRHRI